MVSQCFLCTAQQGVFVYTGWTCVYMLSLLCWLSTTNGVQMYTNYSTCNILIYLGVLVYWVHPVYTVYMSMYSAIGSLCLLIFTTTLLSVLFLLKKTDLFVCLIITYVPLDLFASNFNWGGNLVEPRKCSQLDLKNEKLEKKHYFTRKR